MSMNDHNTSSLRNRKNQTSLSNDLPHNHHHHVNSNPTFVNNDESDPTSNDHDDHSSAYTIIPLMERKVWLRLDVYPFAFMYMLLIWIDQNESYYQTLFLSYTQSIRTTTIPTATITTTTTTTIENHIWSMLLTFPTMMTTMFGSILLLHVSIALFAQWNIRFRSKIGYYNKEASYDRTTFHQWTHCLIQQSSSHTHQVGTMIMADIVPIHVVNHDRNTKIIHFHNHVFRCHFYGSHVDADVTLWKQPNQSQSQQQHDDDDHSNRTLQFCPVRYPIDLPLSFYTTWKGYTNLSSTVCASQVYGSNAMQLQLPSFFLFQFFCVILWSLDEYWYYAILTLVAIIIFEATMAYNRIQSLQRLHRVSEKHKNQRIDVKRSCSSSSSSNRNNNSILSEEMQWMTIFVSELLPGDWIRFSENDHFPIPIPADILLMNGTAVCDEALLTGESIPQLKQSLDVSTTMTTTIGNHDPPHHPLDHIKFDIQASEYKQSILFGGTILLSGTNESTTTSTSKILHHHPSRSHDDNSGVEGIVLRTGFETSQGNLLRTMAHTSNSADSSVHTKDTFVFIVVLLLCAIFAASYVLYESWYDERRNHFRLLLHVIMIVTSVVPPELPMELSLAITNSVASLMKRCQVYCTEHFRMAWAGEINICCFDKTGTLTSDEMYLIGIRIFDDKEKNNKNNNKNNETTMITSTTTTTTTPLGTKNKKGGEEEDMLLLHPLEDVIPWTTRRIMAGCHALAMTTMVEGKSKRSKIVGDPLEMRILKESKYEMMGNNRVVAIATTELEESNAAKTLEESCPSINILHRFPFSSKLKRMTTLVTEEGGKGIVWALTKGAPETIKGRLKHHTIPIDYDTVSTYHMSRGRRVLAMAYREAGTIPTFQVWKDKGRDYVETDLLFAGFLIMECPLKHDSKMVITELKKSGHQVMMITGDAMLTAAEVARQVGIIHSSARQKPRVYRIQKRHLDHDKHDLDQHHNSDPLSYFEYVPLLAEDDDFEPVVLSTNMNLVKQQQPYSHDGIASFCITGDVLVDMALRAFCVGQKQSYQQISTLSLFDDEKNILLSRRSLDILKLIVPHISVFARHAPHQKEAVIAALNLAGYQTLMCGGMYVYMD
jgi:predicted P-type ATPase